MIINTLYQGWWTPMLYSILIYSARLNNNGNKDRCKIETKEFIMDPIKIFWNICVCILNPLLPLHSSNSPLPRPHLYNRNRYTSYVTASTSLESVGVQADEYLQHITVNCQNVHKTLQKLPSTPFRYVLQNCDKYSGWVPKGRDLAVWLPEPVAIRRMSLLRKNLSCCVAWIDSSSLSAIRL